MKTWATREQLDIIGLAAAKEHEDFREWHENAKQLLVRMRHGHRLVKDGDFCFEYKPESDVPILVLPKLVRAMYQAKLLTKTQLDTDFFEFEVNDTND